LERLQKVFAPLANPNFDLSKFDWLAASGGGVGIKLNGKYIRPTINDIDFRGSGVTVTQAGGGVIVSIENTIHNTLGVTGATYYAVENDYYIGVSYAGPSTVVLPFATANGKELVVKDESGHAGDGVHRQITVQGSSGQMIDNHNSAIININNGALQMIYRNGWRII
jgi:hypothetical protein